MNENDEIDEQGNYHDYPATVEKCYFCGTPLFVRAGSCLLCTNCGNTNGGCS